METTFTKYKKRGAGYHWEQASRSLLRHNAFVSARFDLIEKLIQKSNIRNKHILDIGCGDGVLAHKLAKLGVGTVVGMDSSPEAITFAKEKCESLPNTQFVIGSAYTLPFQDHCFDSVISTEVIEHLENPERMLSEIRRVWNGVGAILISTPIRMTKQPLDSEHVQEFFQEDFESLIREYFDQATMIKTHPLFWKELQQKRMFKKPFGKVLLNLCDVVFGINPFLGSHGWNLYAIQTAIIKKQRDDSKLFV